MIKAKEKYVVDEKGKRIGVVIDMKDYRKLMDQIEELESIRAYDKSKSLDNEKIPFDQAIDEIEKNR